MFRSKDLQVRFAGLEGESVRPAGSAAARRRQFAKGGWVVDDLVPAGMVAGSGESVYSAAVRAKRRQHGIRLQSVPALGCFGGLGSRFRDLRLTPCRTISRTRDSDWRSVTPVAGSGSVRSGKVGQEGGRQRTF